MKSRALFLISLATFVEFAGLGTMLPLLPFSVQSMRAGAQTLGFLLATFSIAQLLLTPGFAHLSDQHGRKKIILLSLAGQTISMTVFAVGIKLHVLGILFVAAALSGSMGGNVATCQAVVTDLTIESERVKAMGRVAAGVGLGFVVGPILGGTLRHFGASVPAVVAAAVAVTGFVVIALWMPETRASLPHDGADGDAVVTDGRFPTEVLRDSRIIRSLLINFLSFASVTALQVAAALAGQQRLGWAERETGYAFTLYGGTSMLVQLAVVGRLTRAIGERGAMRVACLLQAIGMAGLAAARSNLSAGAALASIGVGMGVVSAVLPSTASTYAPAHHRGSILGVLQASAALARAIGPIWAGFLCARLFPGAAFLSASLMAIAAFALVATLGTFELSPRRS